MNLLFLGKNLIRASLSSMFPLVVRIKRIILLKSKGNSSTTNTKLLVTRHIRLDIVVVNKVTKRNDSWTRL